MNVEDAIPFLETHRKGVLITLKRDGRPQASNIVYGWSDGVAQISVTADRAKTHNALRDPRVSLHVASPDFWSYVVVEGLAEVSMVSTSPRDEVGVELAVLFEQVSGKAHPNWDEFYAAMVEERRLVLRIHPERVYGQLPR